MKSFYVFGGSLAVPVLVGSGRAEILFGEYLLGLHGFLAAPVFVGSEKSGASCLAKSSGLRWVGSVAVPVLLVGEERCLP